jgi:hypothetical protein
MAETLVQFASKVAAGGVEYEARACGSEMPDGLWQGWIEFVPVTGGTPLRTSRETTQPNRADTVYWATGLTGVYLEGALKRALEGPPHASVATPPGPTIFSEPSPATMPPLSLGRESVLDPFSVYQKGEGLLRKQLGALSAWHLVNIAVDFELTDLPPGALNDMPPSQLIELIVSAVRTRTESASTADRRR